MKFLRFILVGLFLILSGCGANSSEFVEVDGGDKVNKGSKPSLEIEIKVDGDKAILYIETDLQISKEHYGSKKNPGEGHIHVYLDNGEKQGITTIPHILENLSTGDHQVRVSLHNNDHTPYGVSKTLEFEVK
ncbi:hypothetical protein LCL95_16290 [Bacillus timonensis]|nr:hypothetical protein [Bacillus timonensis]